MTKKIGQTDLTQGVIWKQMLVFSIPILLTNLFQQLYSIVDAAIVGSYVGSEALAAVGSIGSLVSLIVGFFMGLASGASVVISRYYGAKDDENVSKSVHTSMAMGIICGIFLTVFGYFMSPVLLKVMHTPENVIGLSEVYLKIFFLGMVPAMFFNIGAGILRAVGDSTHPLIYLVISGVLNFILDLLFVITFNMGVAGASLATVISQAAAAVLVVIQLMSAKGSFRFVWKKLSVNLQMLLSIIKIGIPAGLSSMLFAISNMLIQTNINEFGSDAMAGCAAYSKLDGFLYMPLNAFGLAATSFTGQNMGAEKYDRVRKGAMTGILLSSIAVILAGIVVIFCTPSVVAFLTKGNEEAIKYAIWEMWFLAPFYFLFAPSEILSGVIRGAGSALKSTIITACGICLFRVLMVIILNPVFNDIRVVFAAYPISWAVSSIAFLIYYKFGNWMKRKV